ncbi:hypothetical protein [Paraburkholderia sp. BL10I2N1]|uniref:hypothetical protein n=1 Tax=Paraburkholderia sp. BL10I2N1 TaxID=1938796 RepID=UPI00141505C5|nr:hypothetical protein [Paraburkholderia sp. BL10I2N1]
MDHVNRTAIDENTGTFVGEYQLHQRAELLYCLEEAVFARWFGHAKPINKRGGGIAGIARNKARNRFSLGIERPLNVWHFAHEGVSGVECLYSMRDLLSSLLLSNQSLPLTIGTTAAAVPHVIARLIIETHVNPDLLRLPASA